MASLRAHGVIWKDTYPGVWTAMIDVLGQTRTAYDIEIEEEDGFRRARTTEGESYRYNLILWGMIPDRIELEQLADLKVVIVIW